MLRWTPWAWALVACTPRVVVTPTGPSLVVSVPRDGAPRVRAVDLEGDAVELTGDPDKRVAILGYDRPLAELGLAIQGGELALAGDAELGVPLPPPTSWIELDADGTSAPRALDDWSADSFPTVRVPAAACPRLEEAGPPLALDLVDEAVTVAQPLGDDRWILGLRLASPALSTALRVVGPSGEETLPYLMSGSGAFVEPEGAVWLVATPTAAFEPRASRLCRVDPADPARPRCHDAGPLAFALLSMDGWRAPDGTLTLVALTPGAGGPDDPLVVVWRGDTSDEGRWQPLLRTPRTAQTSCQTGLPGEVVMDGPGSGAVLVTSAVAQRWVLTGAGFDATPIAGGTEVPEASCIASWQRSSAGFEVLIEQARVDTGVVTFDARLSWRDDAHPEWSALSLPEPLPFSFARVFGDVVLLVRLDNHLTAVVRDPRRPDLPPRVCPSVAYAFTYWLGLGSRRTLSLATTVGSVRLSRWRVVH